MSLLPKKQAVHTYTRAAFAAEIASGSLRDSFPVLRGPGMQIRLRYNQRNREHGYATWDPVAYIAGGYGDAGDLAAAARAVELSANDTQRAQSLQALRHEIGDLIWVAAVIAEQYTITPVYPEAEAAEAVGSPILNALAVIARGGALAKSVMAAQRLRDPRSDDLPRELAVGLGGYIAAIEAAAQSYGMHPIVAYLDTMDELHARLDAGKE